MQSFPFSLDAAPQYQMEQPEAADAVVIGGGVIGVSTALFLAERGQSVVLLEKGRIAAEQSSRNWGWVRQQGRDAGELPVMIEANRLWRGMAERLGEDVGFRQAGVLYLADDEADLARLEKWLDIARPHGLDTRMVTRAELRTMLPGSTDRWPGGLWTASDGRAEPWLAVPAMARAAGRAGVTIIEDCAARTIERTGGSVSAVWTERGRLRTPRVLVAAGAWSSLFLRNAGIELPQLSVRATVAATAPLPEVFAGNAADDRIAFRRREDGGYSLALCDFHEHFVGPDSVRRLFAYRASLTAMLKDTALRPAAPRHFPDAWSTPRRWTADEVSPFERMRIIDPAPDAGAVGRIRSRFAEAFPALGTPTLTHAWSGLIDTLPDVVPTVDEVPGSPGLFVATGMSGHGFGIGPAFGRILADLMTGRPAGHDMARFRFNRFTDGSPLVMGPAL